MLRKKINDGPTSTAMFSKNIVVEGGWVHKRLYDVCWSDENKCQGCNKEEGTEKTRNASMSVLEGSQKSDPRGFKDMGATSKDTKERPKVAERNHDASFE